MSVIEEKARTWVEPYTRADGTEVAGYWRGVADGFPEWPIMPDNIHPDNFAMALRDSTGPTIEPGNYKAEEVFVPLLKKEDDLRPIVWEAFKAIDRKHDMVSTKDHPLRKIPVIHTVDEVDDASAKFYSTMSGAAEGRYLPTMITVGDKAISDARDNRMLSAVHEIGHYVDQQMLGREKYASIDGALDETGPLKDVMEAIWTSRPFQQLRVALQYPDDYMLDTNIGPVQINKQFINYLMLPEEAFARAYTQWVLQDHEDENSRWMLDRLSNDARSLYPQQWGKDEFKEISAEMDKVFKKFKKRKKKAVDVPFEEAEHPRDRLGRFADKPSWDIPKPEIYRARWPLSVIEEGDGTDWQTPVRRLQEKGLPTIAKLRRERTKERLPDDLKGLYDLYANGDTQAFAQETRRLLDEFPPLTTVKVFDDYGVTGDLKYATGTYIKQKDGRWASYLDPGSKMGDANYADRIDLMAAHPGVVRGIAFTRGDVNVGAVAAPIHVDEFSEALDDVIAAGNAIHAEIGRRLRAKGFDDIQVDYSGDLAELKEKREAANKLLYDAWHYEMKQIYKEKGLDWPAEDVEPFDERWNVPVIKTRPDTWGDWLRIRSAARKTTRVKKALKKFQQANGDYATAHYNPELVENTAKFKMRRDTILEVLSEVRDMGKGKYNMRKASRKEPIRVAGLVAKFLPTDWVKASNDKTDYARSQLRPRFVKGRGYYSDSDNEANASTWRSRVLEDDIYFSVMAHELIHRAEYTVPTIKPMEWAYLDRRKGVGPEVSLRKLYPRSRYRKTETTWPDEFVDAYAGKNYGDQPTSTFEIMTTGVQDMLTGVMGIFNFDPDHSKFVLGMLAAA